MMTLSNTGVKEELRNLIVKSCDLQTYGTTFYSLHKDLLKFYFETIEVTIDYDKQLIALWNSKPKTESAIHLYDINEAVSEKVNYSSLEETLCGCIEDGSSQYRFYKNLIQTYQNTAKELDNKPWSA